MSRRFRFSATLFYGRPDHSHPPGKVWWGKLGTIIQDAILIFPTYEEVVFRETDHAVGTQGLAGLVNEARVVPDLKSD